MLVHDFLARLGLYQNYRDVSPRKENRDGGFIQHSANSGTYLRLNMPLTHL